MDKKQEKKIYTLPVVVDKSHLITIGEQLYSESIELIRELVNNSYDADATTENLGIEFKVKGVTIKREMFGMQTWARI